jgi:murein DD-endopeptidase MepM/ murein hydrolase activator NlpD
MDVKGYECRMSPTLEYRTELHGHLDDKTTIRIISLDFDFLERVSDWVKEHYPNGELSGGFSRDRIRPAEYVDEGRYRYTLACSQNKKGIAAKRALWAEFFDETFHRKDMDADAEKQKILRDIEQGKAAAHKDAAEMDKETNAMLIYRDPATGWLYRVSPQPEHGSYVMQYRDPANSATWKWCANWNIGNIYRESLEEVLEARAKRDGWELVSGPASSEPPEVVDEGEEYSPCDTCRCPDCIESSCPQAGCDKTDGGFGCFAPYEECPAPAEETCPDERLEKEVGKCKNQSVPNGDAAATTAGSAAPEPAETSTTPTDANTLPAPGCPADAGSATQSLSAAGPASLEAEPEATPFDYSGLDAQTVATLHSAENIIRSARKEYVIKVADAVGMAHDELVANCDKRGNQYSENTFRAWCASVGIGKDAAYRLLQVSNLLESSTPNEQKILKQASPSLLYAAARPSAEPEAVEALKGGDITTHKQYRELEARLKAEREAREKATAEAERLRYANDALRDEAATARAQAKHAQEKADALETRPVISELFDAKERIKELEARPVEVAVQEPDPAEVERRAGEKAREMTSMLQAQVRGMQEDLDDARKIIDSAESATYMVAAEFAVNAAQVLNGIRASFWAVAKELSDEDFSSAAAPLLEAANRIVDCEWDDDEEEQE